LLRQASSALLAFVVQLVALPALPPRDQASLKGLRDLLTRGPVRIALLAVLLVISGHFAGFTYIRPVLEDVTKLSVAAISAVLLGYGIGGFFGNFAGGWLAGRSERYAIVAGSAMIALLAAALLIGGSSTVVTAVAVTLWGFAFGAFPVGFQTWIVRAAPDQAEAAGGLLVAAFQIAIATGAIVGGLMVDWTGALGAPAFAMVAVALGGLLAWRGPGPTRLRYGGHLDQAEPRPEHQPSHHLGGAPARPARCDRLPPRDRARATPRRRPGAAANAFPFASIRTCAT
jgi:predicted MFS family arabinose efflux permease